MFRKCKCMYKYVCVNIQATLNSDGGILHLWRGSEAVFMTPQQKFANCGFSWVCTIISLIPIFTPILIRPQRWPYQSKIVTMFVIIGNWLLGCRGHQQCGRVLLLTKIYTKWSPGDHMLKIGFWIWKGKKETWKLWQNVHLSSLNCNNFPMEFTIFTKIYERRGQVLMTTTFDNIQWINQRVVITCWGDVLSTLNIDKR